MPLYIEEFLADVPGNPKNLISIERERCHLTVSFAMDMALLSQCTGVGGCLWPSSSNASQKILPSLQL